jgi:hypothetical protein
MAGPIVGTIEHYFAGAGLTTASVQTFFVNCYNFLNNNTGSLGVQRIAFNTGSQDTGMTLTRGMNFYDQSNPAGQNAFACFRFLSASVPFDVLIQWTGGSAAGTAPGAPAQINGSTPTNTFGIAFAQRSGSTAWGGTTGNAGSDAKSTPVWTSGAVEQAYYPRSNDGVRAGTHAASRQNMMGFSVGSSTDYRAHFIADYDHLAILYDAGADGTYDMIFFGTYTPMSGLSPTIPYFAFHANASIAPAAATAYGTTVGNVPNGAVPYPNTAVSGTCSVGFDRLGTGFLQNSNAQANKAFATPRWDEFPVVVGIFESPSQVGMLGQHNTFLREVYNIAVHDTNGDGSRAVFGSSLTLATVKMTLPFHTGTTPGSGVTRTGVRFSVP